MIKKKIAILGSTGSIGKSTLDVIKKNKKKFLVILLSANSNYQIINHQIKMFRPKYFIVNDIFTYRKLIKKNKKGKTKIINNF